MKPPKSRRIAASNGMLPAWTPFERIQDPVYDPHVALGPKDADLMHLNVAQCRQRGAEYWRNSRYLVQKSDAGAFGFLGDGAPAMWWLRVWQLDGRKFRAGHWNELQRIKNELVIA